MCDHHSEGKESGPAGWSLLLQDLGFRSSTGRSALGRGQEFRPSKIDPLLWPWLTLLQLFVILYWSFSKTLHCFLSVFLLFLSPSSTQVSLKIRLINDFIHLFIHFIKKYAEYWICGKRQWALDMKLDLQMAGVNFEDMYNSNAPLTINSERESRSVFRWRYLRSMKLLKLFAKCYALGHFSREEDP